MNEIEMKQIKKRKKKNNENRFVAIKLSFIVGNRQSATIRLITIVFKFE